MSDSNDKKQSAQDLQDKNNEAILSGSNSDLNQDIMKNLIRNAAGAVKRSKNIPRLAFAEDPNRSDNYAGIYKLKRNLLPDNIIKQIRVNNFLIACILRARGNALSMMGHVRKDRFDSGIEINIKPEFKDHIEPEQMEKIKNRIDKFEKKLLNCGYTDGLEDHEKMTLPTFLYLSTQNGLSFGRLATEIIRDDNGDFHRFRAVDAGTIYRTVKKGDAAEGVRKTSIKMLETLTGDKINARQMDDDQYPWVQVIDGTPKQAFTSDEMIVYNLYPSTDIEHNGYPVTPIDTVMNSITTHISIEVYNKLYFQNGRAARGILVVNSDEIDQSVIEDMKQQFNASINNVTNSFRTPIFGVAKEDDVNWVPTQTQSKDGEFQFLFDQTTRNILSAFNMSPDELPGFTHLSRGTNQQSLSESNNEYKLIAARDTGIRPLLLQIESFLNEKLFPIIDKELAQLCTIELSGFDALTPQQEAQRLNEDSPLHYNYDEVMEHVEKEQVGPYMSGKIPFNERYRMTVDAYNTVGELDDFFRDTVGSTIDPMKKYKRDQFFFQWIQLMMEIDPIKLKAFMSTSPNAIEMLKLSIEEELIED